MYFENAKRLPRVRRQGSAEMDQYSDSCATLTISLVQKIGQTNRGKHRLGSRNSEAQRLCTHPVRESMSSVRARGTTDNDCKAF
jgi:hypothetical protein